MPARNSGGVQLGAAQVGDHCTRVAFVTGDPAGSSARVRTLDHLAGLAALDVQGELLALPRGWLARRRFFAGLARHDVVVLARRLLGEGDLVALRRAARALVLDLDDAVWTRPFRSGGDRRLRGRFADALRASDVVIVGSAALRDELRGRHPRVRVLPPTCPPPARPCEGARDPDRVRLLWLGSRATLPYLESIGPVLRALAREGAPFTLEVVADARPSLPTEVPVTFTPWSLEAEATALARADVGLYPLAGDAWSRGKCAYKIRRYMAFGLPTIGSRHGAGLEVLDPPEAGLMADDEGEWLRALRTLLADPALRRRLGARARGLALTRDGHADRTRTLASILGEAAAIGRARAGNSGLLSPSSP